jgi:hypothetical protein
VGIQALNKRIDTVSVGITASSTQSMIASAFSSMKEFVLDKVTATLGVFKRVEVEELCIKDTCVTEDQLKELLQKNSVTITTKAPEEAKTIEPQVDTNTASSTPEEGTESEETDSEVVEPVVPVSTDTEPTVTVDIETPTITEESTVPEVVEPSPTEESVEAETVVENTI